MVHIRFTCGGCKYPCGSLLQNPYQYFEQVVEVCWHAEQVEILHDLFVLPMQDAKLPNVPNGNDAIERI